jgi:UDP-glucose 4-epimerase
MEVAIGMRKELQIFGNDYETPDGTGVRDYVHVSDLADAHVRAFDYLTTNNNSLVVNLGSENGISVKEMVDKARKITGKPIPAHIVPRRPGDSAKLIASSGLANKLLGWKAKYSDAETLLSSTWSVYKNSQ